MMQIVCVLGGHGSGGSGGGAGVGVLVVAGGWDVLAF